MPNENLVTITVTRDNEVQDAGGGFSDGAATTVYSGDAWYFPAMLRTSEEREEAGPGIETVSLRYFKLDRPVVFTAPATRFLPQDVIVIATGNGAGDKYRVSRIWDSYAKCIQLEAFRLH